MNYRRSLSCLLAAFTFLVAMDAAPLRAQDADEDAFRQAEELIRDQAYEQGIHLLDSLFQEDPAEYRVYIRLKDALTDQGEYIRAAEIAGQHLETGEPTPSGYASKARLLHQAGETNRADKTWQKALELDPYDITTYQTVYRSLAEVQRFGQAVEVILQAREALDEPDAFEHELPYLLAAAGRYEEAGYAYASTVRSTPDRLRFIKNRIAPFLNREDAIQPLLAGISQMVREHEREPALRRLIGWVYLQDDQFDKALHAKKAADELGNQDGTIVLDFAREALDSAAFDVADEALTYLEDRYPRHAELSTIRFLRAEAMFEAARAALPGETADTRFTEAIEAYRSYVNHHGSGEHLTDALTRIGEIQLEYQNDLAQATETLERVREEVDDPRMLIEVEFNLARAAMMRSALDEADELFGRVSSSESDLAQRAALNRARLAMLKGELEAALSHANQASSDASAPGAREAIRLRVLLVENKHAPDSSALVRFAEADFEYQRGQYEGAIEALENVISAFPSYPLADDARLLRAHALDRAGYSDRAREAFAHLAEEHPGSPVADQGLFEAARLYEPDDPAYARELYMQLLTNYPASLHAPDARQRARELQNE